MFYHISVTYDAQRNLSQYSTSLNIAEGGSYWFNTILPISLFVMFIPNAAKILFLLISLVIGLVFIVYLIWICKALSLFFFNLRKCNSPNCLNACMFLLMNYRIVWNYVCCQNVQFSPRFGHGWKRLVNINTDDAARWKFLRWTL